MDFKKVIKISISFSAIILGISLFGILLVILPKSSNLDWLLERLYLYHDILLYILILFLINIHVIYFIRAILIGLFYEFVKHFFLSWIIFGIFSGIEILVFNNFVNPKLININIIYPENNSSVAGDQSKIGIDFRKIIVFVYPIVKTQIGTRWVQPKIDLPKNKFKGEAYSFVKLGEGAIGRKEHFLIYTIATNEVLKMGEIRDDVYNKINIIACSEPISVFRIE